MIATLLASLLLATNPNATSCATISNVTDTASWTNSAGRIITAEYKDRGGPRLLFARPVPKQVRQAEAALQFGTAGPKTITVCS